MAFPNLINEQLESCTMLESRKIPDGEGGWQVYWEDGMSFDAAITHNSTIEARVAESEGMASTFTVWTQKSMPLGFHDVFRRERDGQVFRVTSEGEDERTPERATFQLSHVSAERWQI